VTSDADEFDASRSVLVVLLAKGALFQLTVVIDIPHTPRSSGKFASVTASGIARIAKMWVKGR
jgi:hypothetical protein